MITVQVDPTSRPPWYARVVRYMDARDDATEPDHFTSINEVCEAVRGWLVSVSASDDSPS